MLRTTYQGCCKTIFKIRETRPRKPRDISYTRTKYETRSIPATYVGVVHGMACVRSCPCTSVSPFVRSMCCVRLRLIKNAIKKKASAAAANKNEMTLWTVGTGDLWRVIDPNSESSDSMMEKEKNDSVRTPDQQSKRIIWRGLIRATFFRNLSTDN